MDIYPARLIDYARRSKDPAAWHSVGFSLHIAAHLLWRELQPALEAWTPGEPLSDKYETALRLRGPFAMLEGMSIEALLKGVICLRRTTNRIVKTHDLITLGSLAGVKWTEDEEELLGRLKTFVVWAGRYPVPVNEEDAQASRILKRTDYLLIVSVATRLQNIHLGRQ